MTSDMRRNARRGLDRRLADLAPTDRFDPPPRGWIRAIRDAIGMSGVQLASRLGVRPQTVDAIERSEVAGSIQLDTLRRAADALDCRLVYALVPRTSLEDLVDARARRIATRALRRVGRTMALEGQAVDDADAEARIDAYIRDVIRDRDLWRES